MFQMISIQNIIVIRNADYLIADSYLTIGNKFILI